MITVSEKIEQILHQTPFLEEALSMGLINTSALARQLQPELQKELFKDIQIGAIVMALSRLIHKLTPQSPSSPLFPSLGDITVRSDMVEFTYTNSPSLVMKQSYLLSEVSKHPNTFFTFTQGVFETTFIASHTLASIIENTLQNEPLKSKIDHLSTITITLPEATVNQPGVYYQILKVLAWNNINLIEVISSYTELTLVMEDTYIDQAFSVLKNWNLR
jgi:aspartokinase